MESSMETQIPVTTGIRMCVNYWAFCLSILCNLNTPVVIGICNPEEISSKKHHQSFKLSSKLKFLNLDQLLLS